MGTVLVVDDEAVMRHGLRRALEGSGFTVAEADSGTAALAVLGERSVEVVLTDLRMPGRSGLELLREVKARWPETEVILMTAYADAGVAEESLALGAAAVLLKPFARLGVVTDAVAKSLAAVQMRRGERPDDGPGLARILEQSGRIGADDLAAAKAEAESSGRKLREVMVAGGTVSEEELDWIVSEYLEVPYVRLNAELLDRDLIAAFPARLARRYRCLPLFRSGDELHLVAVFPVPPEAAQAIGRELGVRPVFALGDRAELGELIARVYGPGSAEVKEVLARLAAVPSAERDDLIKRLWDEVEVVGRLEAEVAQSGDEIVITVRGRVRPN
jgi:CheY-like chemotaxis protein